MAYHHCLQDVHSHDLALPFLFFPPPINSAFAPKRNKTKPHLQINPLSSLHVLVQLSLHMLLLFSHQVIFSSLPPRGLQHTRLPCPSPSPGVCSNSCPLSRWCFLIISSSVAKFSFCFQSSQHQGLALCIKWVGTLHQVAKVLELQLQHQSFQWVFRVDFL